MAKVVIREDEKQRILGLMRRFTGKQMSVAAFAKEAHFNPNRTRFIVDELVEEGRIEKILVKRYNEKFKRFSYKVVE